MKNYTYEKLHVWKITRMKSYTYWILSSDWCIVIRVEILSRNFWYVLKFIHVAFYTCNLWRFLSTSANRRCTAISHGALPKWKNTWPVLVIWFYRWSFIHTDSQCIDMWLMDESMCHCFSRLNNCYTNVNVQNNCQFSKGLFPLNGETIYLDCILGTSKCKWFGNTFPKHCTLLVCAK